MSRNEREAALLASNPISRFREAVAKIAGEASDIPYYGWVPAEQMMPCVFVMIDSTDRYNTSSTTLKIEGRVIVLVGAQMNRDAQQHIDELLAGPKSISRALDRNQDALGEGCSLSVVSSDSLAMTRLGRSSAWGHSWRFNAIIKDTEV